MVGHAHTYDTIRDAILTRTKIACVCCIVYCVCFPYVTVLLSVGVILTYNDRDVTHLHIKWGVAVGPNVVGAGTRHLPPSRIHAPVTNPR